MKRRFDGDDLKPFWTGIRIILIILLLLTAGLYLGSTLNDVADAYFRGPGITFNSQPWETQDAAGRSVQVYAHGDPVYVAADFTVVYAGGLHTELLLVSVDGERPDRRLTPTEGTILPGTYQTTARAATLPADTAPGRYRVVGTSKLTGKLSATTASWATDDFEVR